MIEKIEQQNRILAVTTALGENVLSLQSFRGVEELSQLFSYSLDLLSSNDAISPVDIVGKQITFSLKCSDDTARYFSGYVKRFVAKSRFQHGYRCYHAEVVPWLWFLTKTSDCRVFQDKPVDEILATVFEEFGFTDYVFDLRTDYPARNYSVQYRESAFDFVSRLMEEHGIFYWFEHASDKHTLRLADHVGAYAYCDEATIQQTHGSLAEDHISEWDHQFEFTTGRWAQTDYDFEAPRVSLRTATETLLPHAGAANFEHFDYPGRYVQRGHGEALTHVRMEHEEAGYETVVASSTCRSLRPAGKFTLASRELADEDGKAYAITRVEYFVADASHVVGVTTEPNCECRFTCIPETVVFRPRRETPKPVVGGQQTAVVVGPQSEQIYTDQYGRVKVQFHWDRRGGFDEDSSCWIRVSQNRAGRGWGECYVPHPGQEVIISFLEGDPDQPVVTGRLYNADNMPPIELPAHRTKLAMRDQGGNFITMQGAGEEQQMVMYSPTSGTRFRIGK